LKYRVPYLCNKVANGASTDKETELEECTGEEAESKSPWLKQACTPCGGASGEAQGGQDSVNKFELQKRIYFFVPSHTMSTCQAFRLTDLQPCRKRSHEDHTTCLSHTNFYDKLVWKDRFLNLRKKRFLLEGLDYPEGSLIRRLQHVLEFSLNSGLIILEETDIRALETIPRNQWPSPHTSLTDVFIVLCGTGKILPQWNKELCRHATWNYFSICTILGCYPNILESRIGRLLANDATHPSLILRMLGLSFQTRLARIHQEDKQNSLQAIFELCISQVLALPQMRSHLLLSDEVLTSYFSSKSKPTVVSVNATCMRNQEKAYHKNRMSQYKEGLAMAVWHPRKMEYMLETGGWPLVAMMSGDDDYE
jgi:hypothetical protein